METSHHAGQDVDRERDPRAPNELPALLVNHDDVDLGMVDLDDFERSTGGVLARRGRHGPKRLGVFSAHRLDPLVDEPQTRFDDSPSRRRPALDATGTSDLQYAPQASSRRCRPCRTHQRVVTMPLAGLSHTATYFDDKLDLGEHFFHGTNPCSTVWRHLRTHGRTSRSPRWTSR